MQTDEAEHPEPAASFDSRSVGMRRNVAITASMVMLAGVLSMTGCGGVGAGGSGGAAAQSTDSKPAKDEINITDIAWSIEPGVDGGDRRMLFEYENKSDCDVLSVRLEGKLKADLTDEEIEAEYSNILDEGIAVEDLRDWVFNAEVGELVAPGARSKADEACLGIFYLLNEEQYKLVEVDMLTIEYVRDGKLYTEYCDLLSGSYSLSSDVVDLEQWSTTDLAKMMPRQDDLLVTDVTETPTRFGFETIGTSRESYESYIEACKEAGFGFDVTSGDDFFYSYSEDGLYSLNIFYNADSEMTVYFDLKNQE